MTGHLDDRLRSATSDVRREVDPMPVPDFRAGPSLPARLGAAAAVLAVIAGGWFWFVRDGGTQITETPVAPAEESSTPEDPNSTSAQTTPRDASSAEFLSTLEQGTSEIPRTAMDRPGVDLVLEPGFGTAIRRLTTADEGSAVAPVTSATQTFNADGSRLLLYRSGSERGSAHLIVDAASGNELMSLEVDPTDIEDLYWDSTDPRLLRFVENGSNRLMVVTLAGEEPTVGVDHTFDGCDTVDTGMVSGSTNAGTSRLGLLCHRDDGVVEAMVYDTAEATVLSRAAVSTASAAPMALPSGSGFVIATADGFDVVDNALAPIGVGGIVTEYSAFTVGLDGNGRDVIVTPIFDDPDATGSVVVIEALTGDRRVIAGPATDYPYPPTGTDFAPAATSAPNLVALVTGAVAPDDRRPLAGEVLLVDLASGTVHRLAHHRMSVGLDGAWGSPMVAVAPDGSSVVFSSDWGTGTVDSYLIDLTRQ